MEKPEKQFSCEFCNSCFTLKRNLIQHLKTSKKCIQNRKDIIDISCIWCKLSFLTKEDLDKHYKKCSINKEAEHISLIKSNELLLKEKDNLMREKEKEKDNLMKEKEKEIERLNNIIKDLTDKINTGPINTTNNTINTTNYNITLNCSKPLLLSKERIIDIMNKTCEPVYIKRGQIGLADWFLNDVCRNDDKEISIECTDKNRKRFRYEDENDIPKEITAFSLVELLKGCIEPFKNTTYYHQVKQQAKEENDMYQTTSIHDAIKDFEKPGSKFLSYLIDKTHIDSINCLIDKKQ